MINPHTGKPHTRGSIGRISGGGKAGYNVIRPDHHPSKVIHRTFNSWYAADCYRQGVADGLNSV